MKKNTLYIIQGFIASGKSTFSKKLHQETKATILNPDESIKDYFTKEEYMNNWGYCFDKTTEYLWEKAKDILKGSSVIFDMGFWYRKDRDYARLVAKENSVNIVHYYLYVPDDILKKRIVDTRPKEWAKIHLENFEKNKSKFEEPCIDESIILINNY